MNLENKEHDPFCLDFLVNETEEDRLDIGREIVAKMKVSEEEQVNQMLATSGVIKLVNGGPNDFFQAVLQVLLEVTNFKRFFIKREWESMSSDDYPASKPYCQMMSELMS